MSKASPAPSLEVVICTYNNAAMLDGVLCTLAGQKLIESVRWGCVVVDNNCTDDTRNVVSRYMLAGAVPELRCVREPQQGLTWARLCGVKSSTAEWVAFVDDDCFLRRDWIARAIEFADSHPKVGAFGGRVLLDWEVEPPHYVRAYGYSFAEQDHGDSQKQVAFLAGAGMVVSRSALSACGWIDGPLLADRTGEHLVSGGDVEIVLRIGGAGYELWYVPACELNHRIPASRISPGYLGSINRSLGVSQALADALVSRGSNLEWVWGSALQAARELRGLAKLSLDAARGSRPSAEISIQANFKLGRLQGICQILLMSSSRRRDLLGRAHRGFRPEVARPGDVM